MTSHTDNDAHFQSPPNHPLHDEAWDVGYDDIPYAEEVPNDSPKRGYTLVSWIVILLLVGGLVVLQAISRNTRSLSAKATNPVQDMTAKAIVGASTFTDTSGENQLQALESMQQGCFRDRMSFAIYTGEILGPESALEELETTQQRWEEENHELSSDEVRVVKTLDRLYTSYKVGHLRAPSVSQRDRAFLIRELGWAGELALVPERTEPPSGPEAAAGGLGRVVAETMTPNEQARKDVLRPATYTFLMFAGTVTGIVLLVLLGMVGVLVFVAFLATKLIKMQLTFTRGHAGVYAETFAVWLLLVGGGIAARHFVQSVPSLAFGAVATLGSLVALGWPVLRGVPWSQVRQDIGLHFGKNPFLEGLIGIIGYPLLLPLVCVGFVVMNLFLLAGDAIRIPVAQFNGHGPGLEGAHPIVGEVASSANFWDYALIFFLASVVAPLVEEIMFRGVLYRHLRELSDWWGRVLSVVASALCVSFVFAIVHPQALVAVPLLMSLAFGFAVMREWRGSLFPAMVAHGLNNALVLTLLIVALKVSGS
ncbi:MAG: lysostaphin resistance A-like protein [Gemmataceae bacterium]